jgi:outer membrane protein OmpA-like peptidoglycan-associated protein
MSVEHEAVVGFRSDSHVLDKPALDALTGSLRAARAVESVAIAGYTDNRGRKAYNDWLADARVRAVRDWLIEHDVPAAHIETDKSNGLCCYIASNETPAGRARNRRVVVTIQAAAPAEVITRTEVSQRD